MKPLRFYEHFACAFGTLWLLLTLCAIIVGSNFLGPPGFIGILILSLIYAFFRRSGEWDSETDLYEEIDDTPLDPSHWRDEIDAIGRRPQ